MKKILRLVTTSVLTLTLVACGEASSSVSSSVSSTPASSVSSVSSAYANVTTVTLSAATATLTQVLGAQRRVTVTAALNANTNPNLALEWFVNGVKSNQTGRVLEYVPTEVGAFVISAKVGNISSNNLTVNVSLPTLAVEEVEWASASQILVTAPGGAVVTVSGNEVLDTSIYDLVNGQYVVNLKTPFTQGQTATLSLAREGEAAFTQVVTYDTREFAISKLQYRGTEVKAVNGVYKIARPFDANTNTETYTSVYQLDFTHKNVIGTSNVPLAVQSTVPTGATAIVDSNSLVTNFTNLQFNVTSATALGVYTHKVTLGPKVVEVKVEVVAPEKEISVVGDTILFDANGDGDLTDTGDVIKAGADGVFEITRPFETMFDLGQSTTAVALGADADYTTAPGIDPTSSEPQFRFDTDAANSGSGASLQYFDGSNWIDLAFSATLGVTANAATAALTGGLFEDAILVNDAALIDSTDESGKYYIYTATPRAIRQVVPGALQQRELKVTYRAINFTKPEFIENQQSVSLKGPSANLAGEVTLFSGMETETLIGTTGNNSATSLPLLVDFDANNITSPASTYADETSTQDTFSQFIDRGTPTGVYTFTITAGTSSNQLTKEVKVRVVEPKAALDLVVVGYASGARTLELNKVGDVYTIEKPIGEDDFELSWYGVLSNYHSSLSTVNQVIADDLLTGPAKNTFRETSITAIADDVGDLGSGFAKANTSYNLVAYEIDVTGPNATLIPEVATKKARVLLGRNKSSVVLFNQNDTQITSSTTYTALDLNGASFADTTATTDGLNRDGLVIDKDTVTGSYVVTLRLDNLVKTFTIVVAAPTAKIALGNNPIAAFKSDADILLVSNGILATHTFSTGAASGNDSGLVTGASNTFKVEKGAAAVSFKANVNLYDFPAGSYNYEVRREYPDGRIEVVSDEVTVTAAKFTAATVQRLPSDGSNLWELDLENAKFDANWTINETSLTALGTYKYTFKFGTVTEVFTINVVEAPSMKLNNLALAGSNLVLFGGAYRVLPTAITTTAMTVVADITQLNLPANAYYTVLATSSDVSNILVGGSDIGDSFTTPTATAADQALVSAAVTDWLKVGSLTSINLGTIENEGTVDADDKVTYTIKFYVPNTANDGFTQIGDSTGLVFAISATALVTP
jgi:hypothetical protein